MEEVHPGGKSASRTDAPVAAPDGGAMVATSPDDTESESANHDARQVFRETTAKDNVDSTSREEKVDLAARRAAILASLDALGPLPSGV